MKTKLVISLLVTLFIVSATSQHVGVQGSAQEQQKQPVGTDLPVETPTVKIDAEDERGDIHQVHQKSIDASVKLSSSRNATDVPASDDSDTSITKKFRETYEDAKKKAVDIEATTKDLNSEILKAEHHKYKPVKIEAQRQSESEGNSAGTEPENSVDEAPKDWDTVDSSLESFHNRNTREVEDWGERSLSEEQMEAREQEMARAEYEREIMEEERKQLMRRRMRELAVNHHIAMARRHEMAARILEGKDSRLDEGSLAPGRLLRGSESGGRRGFLFGDQWLEGYQRQPSRFMPPAEPPAMLDLNEELANPLQVPSYPVPDSPALDELETNHVELLTPIDAEDHLPGERHKPGASDYSTDNQGPPNESMPNNPPGGNDPYNNWEDDDHDHDQSGSPDSMYDPYEPHRDD